MSKGNMVIQKVGGSYQYMINSAVDLQRLESLDPALWAASSAPCSSLNCDQKFLKYLDSDSSGRINISDVLKAWKWQEAVLKNIEAIDEKDSLCLDDVNSENADGQAIVDAFALIPSSDNEQPQNKVNLQQTKETIGKLQDGKLAGDGILIASAVDDPEAKSLLNDIITCSGGQKNAKDETGLTTAQLDKFMTDAAAYIDWISQSGNAEFLPRGEKTAEAYNRMKSLLEKVEEYFRYCRLLNIDENNSGRFKTNPDALPELDIHSPDAIDKYISTAPLATPCASSELNLTTGINPAYSQAAANLAETVGSDILTEANWNALKQELSPYENYLNSIPGSEVDKLGCDRIREHLAGNSADNLRELFELDNQLSGKLSKLFLLEKLLLFNLNIIRLANNFISFRELYTPNAPSIVQAGSLVMDGRHFDLTVYIDDPVAHKKLVPNSNIFIMYLKITKIGEPKPKNLAVAVTSGNARTLYKGKRGIFMEWNGRDWEAEVTDIVKEPVSIREALFLPIRKLGEFLSSRFEKFTASSSKDLNASLDKMKVQAPPPKAPASSTPALLLGGGVGLAAVGSSFALLMNAIKGINFTRFAATIGLIVLVISLPLIITAIVKLRRRNIALFLESAGWAINLQMRLTRRLGKLFTFIPKFPDDAACRSDWGVENGLNGPCLCRYLLFAGIIVAILTFAVVTIHYY